MISQILRLYALVRFSAQMDLGVKLIIHRGRIMNRLSKDISSIDTEAAESELSARWATLTY